MFILFYRSLLRGIMMTACDLAAITKPWEIQRKVASLVSSEFFFQGDLEKIHLHIQPVDMMNRDKMNRLPQMQVEFVDQVCLPVYKCMATLSDALQPMLDGCLANRVQWQRLADEQEERERKKKAEAANSAHNKQAGLTDADKADTTAKAAKAADG
jgi:dual 3',5'-cyclic-AMP and -GMP phosphodiesterase 11